MSNKHIIPLVIVALIGFCTVLYMVIQGNKTATVMIEDVTKDKSMYNPGEDVTLNIKLKNTGKLDLKKGQLKLQAFTLNKEVGSPTSLNVWVDKEEEDSIEMQWSAPDQDFTGYLLKVDLMDGKKIIDTQTIGVDVSSSWVKFPRYGYVHDFGKMVDTGDKIAEMAKYQINAIEYYDWHYRHHQPLAPEVTKEDKGSWEDWAGRKIYGDTIANYIKDAKDYNMVNMAYNMIYAGTDDFFKNPGEAVQDPNQWKLHFKSGSNRGNGEFKFRMGSSPSGNGNLYFVNPLNLQWQEHIFAEENKIFTAFDFDGWHGDTVGDWGPMMTADAQPLGQDEKGEPIYSVLDTYTSFLNNAKEALGDKYLSFNPVGAQGIDKVNISDADVLYAEFWPWDKDRYFKSYATYKGLVDEIERATEESKAKSIDGKGKSLVVKAYINYDVKSGTMNEPAVLLADAAVYAAGGSRLEIGNGDRMLHVEYYPDDNVLMSDSLKDKMKAMSDFIVAYENILRDGQVTTKNKVVIENYKYNRAGKNKAIWPYTREDDKYEILHLINLLGTNNQWRDENGTKSVPETAENIQVKYYTETTINGMYLASPDLNMGLSKEIPFKKGQDENGGFISFEIPRLEYWDMIYMEKGLSQ